MQSASVEDFLNQGLLLLFLGNGFAYIKVFSQKPPLNTRKNTQENV